MTARCIVLTDPDARDEARAAIGVARRGSLVLVVSPLPVVVATIVAGALVLLIAAGVVIDRTGDEPCAFVERQQQQAVACGERGARDLHSVIRTGQAGTHAFTECGAGRSDFSLTLGCENGQRLARGLGPKSSTRDLTSKDPAAAMQIGSLESLPPSEVFEGLYLRMFQVLRIAVSFS